MTEAPAGARLPPMPNPITAYQAADGSLYLTAQAAEAHDARTRAREALVRFLRQYDLEGLPTAPAVSALWRDWIDVCKLHAAAYPGPTRAQAEEAGRKLREPQRMIDVETEVKRQLADGLAKTPLELVSAVRDSQHFPAGLPAQEVIQAVWRLSERGELTVHTQRGVTLDRGGDTIREAAT